MNGARRLLLTGAALTALLALVAVASRGHRPGGGTGGGGVHVPALAKNYLAIAMFVLMLVAAAVAGWGLAAARRQRALAGGTDWRRILTTVVTVLLAIGFAYFYARHLDENGRRRVSTPTGFVTTPTQTQQQPARRARSTEPPWVAALAAGSIALGVALAAIVAARQRRVRGAELDEEAALARALDEVLADTLDDLRGEHDPRKAVIGAYARMERTFAAYRVPRQPAEAPLEYVARVLGSLSVSPWAVRRLTLLFERAKFSTHEVDARMKDEAIEALAAVRSELEAGQVEAA